MKLSLKYAGLYIMNENLNVKNIRPIQISKSLIMTKKKRY